MLVGVTVGVIVAVGVGEIIWQHKHLLGVGVGVWLGEHEILGVGVFVCVGVTVGVFVGVEVGFGVLVTVLVGVTDLVGV